MAMIKNLETGFVTECDNVDVIKVCKNDVEHYEVSDGTQKKTVKKVTK